MALSTMVDYESGGRRYNLVFQISHLFKISLQEIQLTDNTIKPDYKVNICLKLK